MTSPANGVRPPRTVDERIQRLVDEGALAGLPGEGRPFDPAHLAGDDAHWAAFQVMKNNGLRPAWSDARAEIDAEGDRLRGRMARHRAWLAARAALLRTLPADRVVEAARLTAGEDGRLRAELALAVAALNEAVGRYNAIAPTEGLRLLPFSASALLGAAR